MYWPDKSFHISQTRVIPDLVPWLQNLKGSCNFSFCILLLLDFLGTYKFALIFLFINSNLVDGLYHASLSCLIDRVIFTKAPLISTSVDSVICTIHKSLYTPYSCFPGLRCWLNCILLLCVIIISCASLQICLWSQLQGERNTLLWLPATSWCNGETRQSTGMLATLYIIWTHTHLLRFGGFQTFVASAFIRANSSSHLDDALHWCSLLFVWK